jgi:hypothetical protein
VLLLLGDSGSGKSTFCRQLERYLWDNFIIGSRIPLLIKLPSIEQPEHDMIDKHLRKYDFSDPKIQELKRHGRFVVICDGYDECQLGVNLHTTNRFNQTGQWDAKIVISCRNTFLSQDYQGRFLPYGNDRYHDDPTNGFEEVTIVPFSVNDIRAYIEQFICSCSTTIPESSRWQSILNVDDFMEIFSIVSSLMDLVKNPFLLKLTMNSLPSLPINTLDPSSVEITRQKLYDTFIKHWIRLNKDRLEGATLQPEVRIVFNDLLDDGFAWCVTDYLERLAEAIFIHQEGRPVVEYSQRKDKHSWKAEFFSREIEPTLLREASPLSRAGIRHWFLHRSLLEYFYARSFYNPDDSDDDDSDDDYANDSDGDGDGPCDGGDNVQNEGGGINGEQNTPHGEGADSLGNEEGESYGGADDMAGNSGGSAGDDRGSRDNNNDPSDNSGGSADHNEDTPDQKDNDGNSSQPDDNGDAPEDNQDANGNNDGSSRQAKTDSRRTRRRAIIKSRLRSFEDSFSKSNLVNEPSVLQFLVERAQSDPRLKQRLLTLLEQAKANGVPSLAAANAITILYRAGESLSAADLTGIRIPRNYLSERSSDTVQLTGSRLLGPDLETILISLTQCPTVQSLDSTLTVPEFPPRRAVQELPRLRTVQECNPSLLEEAAALFSPLPSTFQKGKNKALISFTEDIDIPPVSPSSTTRNSSVTSTLPGKKSTSLISTPSSRPDIPRVAPVLRSKLSTSYVITPLTSGSVNPIATSAFVEEQIV